MNRENHGAPCKQRFKGIENFLRRVAFNLGNTPSQTEVKIISCIPIDVTDLQQKINTLEKELNEVRTATDAKDNNATSDTKSTPNPPRPYTPIVQTALGKTRPIFSKPKNSLQCKCSQAKASVTNQAINTTSVKGKGRLKPKVSSVCIVSSFSSENNSDGECKLEYKIDSNLTGKNAPVASKRGCKFVPKKLRWPLKKNLKKRTQLVYYTHASKTPFNSFNTSDLTNKDALTTNAISRSYINSMIRKQYESELIVDELSDISQFSSPACRDNSNTQMHSSNLLSGYENFENLDIITSSRNLHHNIGLNNGLAIDQGPITIPYQYNNQGNYKRYYDSNDYDIYPVKEKPIKHKKEDSLSKQIRRSNNYGFLEKGKAKNDFRPLIFNNNETINERHENKPESFKIYDSNGNEYTLTNVTKKKNQNNKNEKLNSDESKMCSIEYGDVYSKRYRVASEMEKSKAITPSFKNAECITVNTNNMECQTVESKGIQLTIPDDNKAEVALDQIKTILQSVLAEVKTNIKSNNVANKPKRNVRIQKDISQNIMTGGSTLLNSFTYNPSCSINPCLPSYSRHVPNICYGNFSAIPMKCFQNYPLLVPPMKLLDCDCQHKNRLRGEKSIIDTKPATTTATNTDNAPQITQKSETVNLIKEIYKSLALNVNYSNKNTSRMSFDYKESHETDAVKSENNKEITVAQQSIADDNRELDVLAAMLTSYSTNDIIDTILESTQSEMRSESVSGQGADTKPSKSTTNYESVRSADQRASKTVTNNADKNTDDASEQDENKTADRFEPKIENETNVKSTTSGNVTNSDETIVADKGIHRKEKPGLLQKMLQTVKRFQRKKVRWQKRDSIGELESEESGTDSQTVYSYKTYRELTANNNPKLTKSSTQTGKRVQEAQENLKRLSPYMEQENRRYWDEKLMFNEGKSNLHTSEKSFAGWTRSPQSPFYWRDYEARSAFFHDAQLNLAQRYRRACNDTTLKEKTGLKLEWIKKKNRSPIK